MNTIYRDEILNSYCCAIWLCTKRHLAISIIKETMFFKNVVTAEANGGWLLTI